MLGERVKELIERSGLSISKVAQLMSMKHPQQLHAVFKQSNAEVFTLEVLAEAINVPLIAFFVDDETLTKLKIIDEGKESDLLGKIIDLQGQVIALQNELMEARSEGRRRKGTK